MATSDEPAQVSALEKIFQDHLECSICKEEYTEPKLLDCLHSFCKHCLLEYHTTNYKDAEMLICPLCRQETQLPEKGVQDLKTNLILTGLAHQLEKDINDGKITMTERRHKRHPECQTHEGEVMRFYCTTCDVMICRDCTVIDHCKPQHEYIDCNQASSTYKQSLAQLITPLEEILKKLEQSQATVSTMKDNLDIAVKKTMAEVKNRADEIWAELKAEESRIMDEIKTIHKDRNKTLEEYEQTVNVNSQQIQQSLQKAKDVSNNSSAPDFLALYPTISKDLKLLRDQNQPKIDSTLSHLRFNPGVCDIFLGNLKEPRWELSLEYDVGVNEAWDIDASVPGDDVAVADNNRVVIYDTEGHHKKTINLSHDPRAVAAFKDQLVVVDESNSVKMYNKNGTKGFEFYTVPPSEVGKTAVGLHSVAVMKDRPIIIVGDILRSVITKHSSSDGSLIDTVSVETKPYYLAIDSKDRVVISGWGQQQVVIVDDNGATLITIKPTINGQQVKYCRGVCCDSSAIYIAMYTGDDNTGHIHQYDTEGRFLSCIAQGLYWPYGISLTSDGQQLAVADDKSVKIYNKV